MAAGGRATTKSVVTAVLCVAMLLVASAAWANDDHVEIQDASGGVVAPLQVAGLAPGTSVEAGRLFVANVGAEDGTATLSLDGMVDDDVFARVLLLDVLVGDGDCAGLVSHASGPVALADYVGVAVDVGEIVAGERRCVRFDVTFPADVDPAVVEDVNELQGRSVTFRLVATLEGATVDDTAVNDTTLDDTTVDGTTTDDTTTATDVQDVAATDEDETGVLGLADTGLSSTLPLLGGVLLVVGVVLVATSRRRAGW